MMDLVVIGATIKNLAKVAQDAGKIDLYQQIIDLQGAILEAIQENGRVVIENSRLTREVERLKQELDEVRREQTDNSTLEYRSDNAYWRIIDGKQTDGPFCAKCKEDEGKLIHMTARGNGFTCCVSCGHCINTPGYVPPTRTSGMVPLDDF
jgi:hypothetical protein